MKWSDTLNLFFPFSIHPVSVNGEKIRPNLFSIIFLLCNILAYIYDAVIGANVNLNVYGLSYVFSTTLIVTMSVLSVINIRRTCTIINIILHFETREHIPKDRPIFFKIIIPFTYITSISRFLIFRSLYSLWRSVSIHFLLTSVMMMYSNIFYTVYKYLLILANMENTINMREGYNKIATIVNKYNQVSQFQITMYFLSDTIYSIRWFKMLTEDIETLDIFVAFITLVITYSRLIAICFIGEMVQQQNKVIQEKLFSENIENLSPKNISEIELFINQIEYRKIRAKAYNILYFNMNLAVKISALIVSVILLLHQLR